MSESKRVITVLGLALYGPLAASHRVRLEQYCKGLSEEGIDLRIQSLLDDEYLRNRFEGRSIAIFPILSSVFERLQLLLNQQRFDAAIVQCELFPFEPGWLERMLLRIPYIYDFDDAWYLRYRVGKLGRFAPLLSAKFDSVLQGAAAITAGNEYLASHARKFNENVTVLPSVVDTCYFAPSKPQKSSTFTVGWIGSPSTAAFLQILRSPLQTLARDLEFKFVVIGGKAPSIEGIKVVELPWSEETEVDLINTFDVGVMPIPQDEWALGKCAYKLVQYMACGVPVVASRVGANIDLVTEDCGFLVSTADQWVNGIRQLWGNPFLRKGMGLASRKRVVEFYSLHNNLPILSRAIHKVTGNCYEAN